MHNHRRHGSARSGGGLPQTRAGWYFRVYALFWLVAFCGHSSIHPLALPLHHGNHSTGDPAPTAHLFAGEGANRDGSFEQGVGRGCTRRGGASEGAPEAVRQAVGGGCESGLGRLDLLQAIGAFLCSVFTLAGLFLSAAVHR